MIQQWNALGLRPGSLLKILDLLVKSVLSIAKKNNAADCSQIFYYVIEQLKLTLKYFTLQ